jgi:hypothetical protein
MTRAEYKPTQKKVMQVLKYKLVYYILFLILVGFEFLFAAGNFLMYNLLGFTIDLPSVMPQVNV